MSIRSVTGYVLDMPSPLPGRAISRLLIHVRWELCTGCAALGICCLHLCSSLLSCVRIRGHTLDSVNQDPRPVQLTAGPELWPSWKSKCWPASKETEKLWFYPLCPSREAWLLQEDDDTLPLPCGWKQFSLRAWFDWCGLSVQLRLTGRKTRYS